MITINHAKNIFVQGNKRYRESEDDYSDRSKRAKLNHRPMIEDLRCKPVFYHQEKGCFRSTKYWNYKKGEWMTKHELGYPKGDKKWDSLIYKRKKQSPYGYSWKSRNYAVLEDPTLTTTEEFEAIKKAFGTHFPRGPRDLALPSHTEDEDEEETEETPCVLNIEAMQDMKAFMSLNLNDIYSQISEQVVVRPRFIRYDKMTEKGLRQLGDSHQVSVHKVANEYRKVANAHRVLCKALSHNWMCMCELASTKKAYQEKQEERISKEKKKYEEEATRT